jgi:hypothetical protein
MEEPFDQLSKALAEGVSRREAFRRAGGLLLGAVLASLGLDRLAWGQTDPCLAVCAYYLVRERSSYKGCLKDCRKCEKRGRDGCRSPQGRCCPKGAVCCGAQACCGENDVCCAGSVEIDGVDVEAGTCCHQNGPKKDCCHLEPLPGKTSNFCVDLKTDESHCGDCNTNCADTSSRRPPLCCDGDCCREGEECCRGDRGIGVCTNIVTNFHHCGSCHHECRSDEICKGRVCLRVTCPAETPFACRGPAANNGEYECCRRKEDCGNGACARVCPSDASVKPCMDANGIVTDCCEPNQVCANGKCEDECLPGLTVCLNENSVAQGCCKPGEICTLGFCVTCPPDWTFCGTPSSSYAGNGACIPPPVDPDVPDFEEWACCPWLFGQVVTEAYLHRRPEDAAPPPNELACCDSPDPNVLPTACRSDEKCCWAQGEFPDGTPGQPFPVCCPPDSPFFRYQCQPPVGCILVH